MGKRFKTLHRRSGIVYAPSYANTIKGVIKQANRRGWAEPNDTSSWDTKPFLASIYERHEEDHWELIGTVSAKGIEAVDCFKRGSVKRAFAEIKELQKLITTASDMMHELSNHQV